MLVYKNNSKVTKTFHGVTFKPGEVKECPGYINDVTFIRLSSMPKEPPKVVEIPKKSETSKVDKVKSADSTKTKSTTDESKSIKQEEHNIEPKEEKLDGADNS